MMWRSLSSETNKEHPHLAFASERGWWWRHGRYRLLLSPRGGGRGLEVAVVAHCCRLEWWLLPEGWLCEGKGWEFVDVDQQSRHMTVLTNP
jgi:hypothetical protein